VQDFGGNDEGYTRMRALQVSGEHPDTLIDACTERAIADE
jgi:hypothetical protein